MTRRALAAASLATVLALVGCSSTDPEPAPATSVAPAPVDVEKLRVQYYTGPDADPDQNWADVYLPRNAREVDSVPLVVLIHGGAWKMPLGAEIFDEMARDLAGRGNAVYNIEYRRVGANGGWPNTFLDVARALDYIVQLDADHPEITVDDEVVVGHSAGAQLATWGGTRNKIEDGEVGAHPKFRPKRVVSISGPLDMVQSVADGDTRIVDAIGGEPSQVPDRYAAVDPIQNLDPTIPVAALHGKADDFVLPHNATRYAAALEKKGGKAYVLLFDGENHTSIVKRGTAAYDRALDVIDSYADDPIEQLPT